MLIPKMVFQISKLRFKAVKECLYMEGHQIIQSILMIIHNCNKKINRRRNNKLSNYIHFLITLKLG